MGCLLLAIFLLPIKIFYWPQKVLWGRWKQNIHRQQRESRMQKCRNYLDYISKYPHPSSPSDSHSTCPPVTWAGCLLLVTGPCAHTVSIPSSQFRTTALYTRCTAIITLPHMWLTANWLYLFFLCGVEIWRKCKQETWHVYDSKVQKTQLYKQDVSW